MYLRAVYLGGINSDSSVGKRKLSVEASTNGEHDRPLKQPATSSSHSHVGPRPASKQSCEDAPFTSRRKVYRKGVPTAAQTEKKTPDTEGKGGGCDRLQAVPETIPTISQSMAFILTDRMQLADQFGTAIVSVCYSARSKCHASCHIQSVSLHCQFGDLGLKRCRTNGACCGYRVQVK